MLQALESLENPEKISELETSVSGFLETYGTRDLMGEPWDAVLNGTAPENRFDALLKACGCSKDPCRFFREMAGQIRQNGSAPVGIAFNGRKLPTLLVYHILETALPGQALCTVRTPGKLAEKTGTSASDEASLAQVLETYPVRLSAHVIRQSMVSSAVAIQYLPFEDELDPTGHELTFDGHFKQGLMEQMYRNRAIFLLDMRCPVYCRFCFRKHKSLRKEASPTPEAVKAALARVADNSDIREILITGGEPLLNRRNLEATMEGLLGINHVEAIRLATRSLAYYPHIFLHHGGKTLAYLKSVHARCREVVKRLEIGLHMVHPDEISIQTLEIISGLAASGIPVYVQTPYLKGVNHEGPVLAQLFNRLRMAGAQIYYIFTPCHPIHGTRKYWSPINLSLEAYAWMRENISDRCMPKLCTATPLGKMEWHTSGWAVERDGADPDHIWIRTPYTRDYFLPMTPDGSLPVETRDNSGGTLDVKCLIDMGDDALFLGEGIPAEGRADTGLSGTISARGNLSPDELLTRFFETAPIAAGGAGTGIEGLTRVHRTRVVLTLDPAGGMTDPVPGNAAGYLERHSEVTDIILRIPAGCSGAVEEDLAAVELVARSLSALGRYLSLRLQWARVQTAPEAFETDHIARLRALNRFDAASPFRLEFETWWLTADQITGAHRRLAAAITDAGMGIYANTALISGINTAPDQAEALVHGVRQAGMEFHHVYTGGLEVQKAVNEREPLPADLVTAVASRIRMNCTGREVPLYVRWTPGGDRDFGF